MGKIKTILPLFLVLFIFTSCYHAKVSTGAEPSAKVYDKSFASSWINGLVPPPEVKAAEECSNGVAKVETRLSFVNMLVGAITLGIYTPMHIKVTCASSASASLDSEIVVPKNSTEEQIIGAFSKASDKTVSSKKPVFVKFE